MQKVETFDSSLRFCDRVDGLIQDRAQGFDRFIGEVGDVIGNCPNKLHLVFVKTTVIALNNFGVGLAIEKPDNLDLDILDVLLCPREFALRAGEGNICHGVLPPC